MDEHLRRFLLQLQPAGRSDPGWEARVDDAGLESFVREREGVASGSVFDPRTGAEASWLEFEPAPVRPEGYPPDWPFLPGETATFTEVGTESDRFLCVAWSEIEDVPGAWEAVEEQLVQTGWQAVENSRALSKEERVGVFDELSWFWRNGRWRSLARGVQPGAEGRAVLGVLQRAESTVDRTI